MLYNNLRIMMHMQGHIDSEKQQNLDLADLTECKHCYKQFDTPFEMQSHIEKVLMLPVCNYKDSDSMGFLTVEWIDHFLKPLKGRVVWFDCI